MRRAWGFCAGVAAWTALAAGSVSCSPPSSAQEGNKPKARKVVPITAAATVRKDMPIEFRTFGTVQAYATVTIRSQVSEIIKTVHFRKGQSVRKGELLFTILPKSFEVALEQAQAALARDIVQADNAEKVAQREAVLLKKGMSSQDEHDKYKTEADALAASVRAGRAAVDQTKLQLEFCSIHSPIDGRAGNLLVDEGNLVKSQDTPLVTLTQTRPIEVSFCLPQSNLPALRRYMAAGKLRVEAVIPGDDAVPEVGELTFVDNTVEKGTGTINLRATFPNETERLWPGQYVQVILTMSVQKDAVVAPSQAIQAGREGSYVFVVRPDKTAELRKVTVPRTIGADAVVTEGLQAGEMVVTDGHLRLTQGISVTIKDNTGGKATSGPASAPATQASPTAQGSEGAKAGPAASTPSTQRAGA
jgi:membrane fusion protein, multidrug efflux system